MTTMIKTGSNEDCFIRYTLYFGFIINYSLVITFLLSLGLLVREYRMISAALGAWKALKPFFFFFQLSSIFLVYKFFSTCSSPYGTLTRLLTWTTLTHMYVLSLLLDYQLCRRGRMFDRRFINKLTRDSERKAEHRDRWMVRMIMNIRSEETDEEYVSRSFEGGANTTKVHMLDIYMFKKHTESSVSRKGMICPVCDAEIEGKSLVSSCCGREFHSRCRMKAILGQYLCPDCGLIFKYHLADAIRRKLHGPESSILRD